MTKAILFDFDYTLADSSDAVVECFNTALAGMGLQEASPRDICRTIGLSIPESLARVAGRQHLHRAEEFRLHWRRRSDEIMVDWTRVFEWTASAAEALTSDGFRLGIVSTKYRNRIEATLERNGLAGAFEIVVGGEDVERHKPDPEGLLRAISLLGILPEEALYVGDSTADAEAARAAGAPFVAVLSGMTEEQEFLDYPRLGVLASIGALPGFLRSRAAKIA